jgi:hypothetical protein
MLGRQVLYCLCQVASPQFIPKQLHVVGNIGKCTLEDVHVGSSYKKLIGRWLVRLDVEFFIDIHCRKTRVSWRICTYHWEWRTWLLATIYVGGSPIQHVLG